MWYNEQAMRKLCVKCAGMEELPAIRENGADEVLLPAGKGSFSASGFSSEELHEAASFCRKEGLAFSVLLDRLFSEEEIAGAAEMFDEALHTGASSVFVSDPGLLMHARKAGVMSQTVYHPSFLVTDGPDAAFWMACGCGSVCVSPLLTFEELCGVCDHVSGLTVILHGRLLMSASGRRLIEAYGEAAGRKGIENRKDVFLREMKREGKMPAAETETGTLIFTDFIQESLEETEVLRKKEISRFIISCEENSMEYTADTVRIYRRLLDGNAEESDIACYRNRWKDMPLSKGYYTEKTIK